ncbi:MAG: GrpB family protein [Nitrincola lacisaponensis]|uniref:GrpB family protein n=1 Tax=Nitrincola lacisaponensis TaxID=267850 RepID=UPI00391DCD14
MNEEESLNRAIYEEVAIFPYDKEWPLLFEEERSRLLHLFPSSFLAIAHIGSTAVPGLSAKPIIDILAGVATMESADALLEPLCQSKYTTSMEFNASFTGRRWLMRWSEGRRTHHLHLVVHGSKEWQQRLAFRDTLRTHTGIAMNYERKKQAWAAEFRSDREAYTAAKTSFIQDTLGYAKNS